jgi:four helix bundle protein
MHFDHERLDVYQFSLKFAVMSAGIIEAFPPGRAHLADQLHRAAVSVILNIAEGAGEFSKGDKARFYRMAKRSATECAGVLDICRELQIAAAEPLIEGRDLLLKIVSMLIKLIRSFETP